MNRIELLKTMYDIVNNDTENYKNDFMYDIDYMYKTSDIKFVWIVRRNGTNIASMWPNKDRFTSKEYSSFIHISKTTIECFYNEHNKEHKFFIVDLKKNTIKRIYNKTIENLIK